MTDATVGSVRIRRPRSLAARGISAAAAAIGGGAVVIAPLVEYQTRPIDFMVEVLGERRETLVWSTQPEYATHVWDGTVDPLVVAAQALADNRDVAMSSGTGLQKSRFCAAIILWWLGCWENSLAKTYAPKEESLRAFMWMEIYRLWPYFKARFPSAVLGDLRIRMRGGLDDTWGAQGVAVGMRAGETIAVGAQGAHAADLLLVYEETPGIKYQVLEAGEQTAVAPHNRRLAVGNPDNQLDSLFLFGHFPTGGERPHVENVRLSALDHPNVVTGRAGIVPGATSLESVNRRRWVGEQDPRWLSRVRGLAPGQAVDALIRLDWVQAAQKAWYDKNTRVVLEAMGGEALGVDVANSEGGDEAAISGWRGGVCRSVVSFPCPDANKLGTRVVELAREFRIPAERVGVDSVGVGAGTVNECSRHGFYVWALNGGDTGPSARRDDEGEERYNNFRSKIQWRLREDLRMGVIALPPDLELAQELITATWRRQRGEICVEQKDEIKKRLPGGRSPNKGDAVAYGNYVRQRTPAQSRIAPPERRGRTLWQEVMAELKEGDAVVAPSDYGTILRQ
jgi:hypothetical protein